MNRCKWVNPDNPAYVAYHDNEWGVPCHDDKALYELLMLECFQAGLSWECVLDKRGNFRRAFDGFDASKVARYDAAKIRGLMGDAGIIRNRSKIEASIVNSNVFLEIQKEFGSFDSYIWGFTDGRTIPESCAEPLSDSVSKDLQKRGMKFVGPVIIHSYLQAVGVINGHGPECDFCGRYSFVNEDGAKQILDTREPRGLFVRADGNVVVGIDNSTGDAWVEEFPNLVGCLNWLLRMEGEDD